jgi:hypothetical protein
MAKKTEVVQTDLTARVERLETVISNLIGVLVNRGTVDRAEADVFDCCDADEVCKRRGQAAA